MKVRRPWCYQRLTRLQQMRAAGATWQQIADALGTSPDYARRKAVAMGYHTPAARTRWTAHMDAVMRRHYRAGSAAQLAKVLRVSIAAVHARAQVLGVSAPLRATRHYWTPQQDAQLIASYADHCTRALAEKVGLRIDQVHGRARRLGIRKSAQQKAQRAAHLKPRQAAPKGTVSNHHTGPAMRIADPSRQGLAGWVNLPRAIWLRERGHVPKGRVIAFRPGRADLDPRRVTIDDIEAITRQQLMARNSVHHVRTKPQPESARARICPDALRRHNNPPWTMRALRPGRDHDFRRRTR